MARRGGGAARPVQTPTPTSQPHPFLQALFRPVSMTVPDLALICEVMLMAEGFQAARSLARKFVGLHRLCDGMLSKARHYDWKLRAIKTTLGVAGAAKRASPGLGEERVRGSAGGGGWGGGEQQQCAPHHAPTPPKPLPPLRLRSCCGPCGTSTPAS